CGRLQRGARDAGRGFSASRGIGEARQSIRAVKPTEAEEYADCAIAANFDYIRYRRKARSLAASSVVKASRDVRIGRDHKWGPQPFHYRNADYESIVDSIREKVKMNGSGPRERTAVAQGVVAPAQRRGGRVQGLPAEIEVGTRFSTSNRHRVTYPKVVRWHHLERRHSGVQCERSY